MRRTDFPSARAAACVLALAAVALAQNQAGTGASVAATVDWTRLTLRFGETLDGDSVPPASAFSVLVGDTSRALAGVSVSGDSAVLALSLPVSPTDVVTVAYDAPGDGGLEDEAGNAVTSFAAVSATNDTPARLTTAGPGLGNLPYRSSELFEAVSWIRNIGPIPGESVYYGTTVGVMLNGYFVVVFAPDAGRPGGGFLIYDVSDPRNLRLVRTIFDPVGSTAAFREPHSLPVARIGDSVYLAIQSSTGIEIWDFTDMDEIHRESRLLLPGVFQGDYENVAWQLSWQAPYLYVAASSQGIYVVDVSDPAEPLIADRGHRRPNPVPPAEYGGFRVGPLFAMGNHLVVTSMQTAEPWSILDIGNPRNPILLDTVSYPGSGIYYSACFDGRRVFAAPKWGGDLIAYDLSDPTSFVGVSTSMRLDGDLLYCSTQDHFLFEGGRRLVTKIDTSTDGSWNKVASGTLDVDDPDAGHVAPMGNLLYVGNDHGTGSALFVHDTNPDLTPPEVVEVSPRNGAANQPLTTSVGVAFTDTVLFNSVGTDSLRLLDEQGRAVSGSYSVNLGVVNFSPAKILRPNTSYTVQVLAHGVSDYAGNRVKTAFNSSFTTTPELPVEPVYRWLFSSDAEDWFDRNDGRAVGARFASGGGLRLDGDGDWIKLERSLSNLLAGDASVAFFLGTTQTGSTQAGNAPGVTGRKDSGGTDDAYWGWLDETGRLRLSVGDRAGIKSPDPINDGNLHHYVLTRNVLNGRLAMYRNGLKIAEGTGAIGTRDGAGSYARLGAIEGSNASLAGRLEDVQIFDHELTNRHVALLYGRAVGGIAQATLDAPGTVGVAARFEAEAQGDATSTYQWDFGDGSSSAASTSRTASHTYSRPGHYTVVLTVTTGSQVRRYNFIKTVTYPRTNMRPTGSSTIVGSGNLVFRANPDNATVTAIHGLSLAIEWERSVGQHPRTVAVDALGRAWVAVQGEDVLECLDASGASCGTIGTGRGSGPYGIAFVPGTNIGLVTLQGSGEVLRFDPSTATVLARKAVNAEPRGIAITADGAHAYVTRLRSTNAGLVTKIDTSTLTRVSSIALEVDSTTVDAEDRARGKPNYLTQVVLSPDGRTAWVPSKQDNTLRGPTRDGQALTHDSTVRAITSILDLASDRELRARRIDFDDRSGAVAMAFSPLGDYAFVVQQGSNKVAIVDAYTGAVKGALTSGPGLGPDGIWIDEARGRAFVSNFTTRSVSVYDIADALDSVSFEPGLQREISSTSRERLAPVELRGLQIFYNAADSRMSRDGYISCASCHLGGGEDGAVWDFTDRGEGLRNTIALDGREGTALGRVHWTANFDEIQDFENDIRNAFGGSGFMTQADFAATSDPLGTPKAGRSSDLDALASYVASLDDFGKSPHRTADGDLTDAAIEGRSLFSELKCESCHSGDAFTDEERHDVGTIVVSSGTGSGHALAGVGFKTPTLLGVWRTAPYFHNGSAATLADVVDSQHGGERALTSAERDKLVAYLLSLERPGATSHDLTAWITGLPASHDGRNAFSFQLTFSANVTLSYLDFGDGALELTGATVHNARRLQPGSNQNWEITLKPTGNGPVVIVLPAGRGCGEPAAVCTEESLPLSESLEASVPGPANNTAAFTVSAEATTISEGESTLLTVAISNGVTFAEDQAIALTVEGTASAADYRLSPATLTLVAGASSATAELLALGDDEEEEPERVTVTASHGGTEIGSATVTIRSVSQDATLSALSLSGIDIGAFSGAVTSYQASVGHSVATTAVAATATHSAATVLIEPGSAVDLAVGANEIRVTVTAEDGATTKTYTVTVTRTGLPEASITAGTGPVTEGAAASFTVTLDQAAPEALTVSLSVTESGSSLSRPPPASVAVAQGETSATLSVPTAGDSVVEGDSTVTVTVTAGRGYTVGTASSASVTVEDDDSAAFTVSAAPGTIAEGETATLTVAISNGVTFAEDQTISLATSGTASASDYTGVPATLTLAAEASSVTATLAALADQEEEEVETVTLSASHGRNSLGSATVTIRSVSQDATLSALSLSGIDIGAFSGAVTSYQASVGHSVATTAVAATATHSAATVLIEPGSAVDLAVAANEIRVTVTAEDGATTKVYTVTVTRAGLPVVSIEAVEERLIGPLGAFTLSRTGPTAEPLEVHVLYATSRNVADKTVRVEIPRGLSSVIRRVQSGDNNLVEDDIEITWTLQEDEGYTVSAEHGSASLVLEESDVPAFTVTADPAGIAEGESATLTVAISNGVRFAEDQAIALSVSGTASGADYTGLPQTLTLAARKTSAESATLAAVADQEEEEAETVTVTASHNGTEIGSATVTIAASKEAPLTAEFLDMPETHDGESEFTFRLRFSEEITISYKTLRDAAFLVTGGAVVGARRMARPSNLLWEITVQPASDADVVLALPPTVDCSAPNVICTEDGLPVTVDCGGENAICTEDGRLLTIDCSAENAVCTEGALPHLRATVRGPESETEGFSLSSENASPSGLWSDGETAWVADLEDDRLYAYRLPDGERQPGRDMATDPAPMGLWSDGETLWVAGFGGGLRAHRLSDGSRQSWRDLALEANSAPAGVWSDGETLWVVDWLGDTVHAYRLSDGRRMAERDIPLAGGNLMPVGLWSDGETLWVADWGERLHAYRLSDGGRDSQRDIEAGSGDTDPTGLWSGGGTLLSTGWESGRVRAYPMPAAVADAPGKKPVSRMVARAVRLPSIPDPALLDAIAAALGRAPGEAVSPQELAGLEALTARNAGIRDLSGLEQAVGLKQLDLGFNPLTDLRPLADLPALESLNLDGAATDLQTLAPLAALQRLSLRHNGIDDLWPMAGLTSLVELDLGNNRIADLQPLAGLARLAVLRADRNRIANLWPLASLVGLEALDLGANRVRDLQPLAGLARLQTLRLGGNSLAELQPLAGLGSLRDLGLAGNAITDLGALSDLDGLRRLDLRGNAARDLRPLRGLPSLVWVHVGGSRISDVSPLDRLPGLTLAGREDRNAPGGTGNLGGHGLQD